MEANISTNRMQQILRILLGAALLYAGISHLSWNRTEFLAQVPNWVPMEADLVVVLSGLVEITLGASLIVLYKQKVIVGLATGLFFVMIFPGNIAQYVNGIDSFGLNTDKARAIRLAFQPLLVLWAIWSTGALQFLRERKRLKVA